MVIPHASLVVALGENPPLYRLLEPARLVFLKGVEVVEATQEKQVCDLLHDLQRVRDTAGPEGVPDVVDLVAGFAGDHDGQLLGEKLLLLCCSRPVNPLQHVRGLPKPSAFDASIYTPFVATVQGEPVL